MNADTEIQLRYESLTAFDFLLWHCLLLRRCEEYMKDCGAYMRDSFCVHCKSIRIYDKDKNDSSMELKLIKIDCYQSNHSSSITMLSYLHLPHSPINTS